MTAHLLVIALGPVQDFIAAARRTRDFWFGSHLLSEISKAAAAAVRDASGALIFPAPTSADDLIADSDFNVANIILTELPAGIDPGAIRKAAKEAAEARWTGFANNARAFASALIDSAVWKDQVNDVIEFYFAWVPLESPQNYTEARRRLMRLLAGRKALRDFKPAKGRERVPKSSLDGARETVLVCAGSPSETRIERTRILRANDALAARLRLSAGEELDVIGITKRAATKETFPSVTRVAADPWLRGIERVGGEARRMLDGIAEDSKGAAFATETGPHYQGIFHYDGAVLFPSRLASMLRPSKKDEGDSYDFDRLLSSQDREKLTEIKTRIEKLQKNGSGRMGLGEPIPYLAVLAADGDRMGRVISHIDSAKKHREFSRKLAEFAGLAKQTVEKHHGCLIYSGGDDVLALAPVNTCIGCARELHDDFAKLLDKWKDDEGKSPTLSVGIAIGHCLEPLEDLLEFARDAEKSAKQPDRDGIAIHLHTRGGVPVKLRSGWRDKLDERLGEWVGLHRTEQMPDKFAFDLRELVLAYQGWPVDTDQKRADLKTALQKDVLRLIKRKASSQASAGLAKAEGLIATVTDTDGARRLADEIIVASHIAVIEQQAQGKAPASAEQESAT